MVFQEVHYFVQADSGFGTTTESGGDRVHHIFQGFEYRPSSVLLIPHDVLKFFSDAEKQVSLIEFQTGIGK